MGDIKDRGDSVYRDWATDGVPASGDNNPSKPEIRALIALIEERIGGAAAGLKFYATKAALDADTTQPPGTLAYVYDDATVANNTVYHYETGGWVIDDAYFEGVLAVVQPLLDQTEEIIADVGTSQESGTSPPATGTAYSSNGYSVVDGAASTLAGTLVELVHTPATDGWAIPFICSDNGDGTVTVTSYDVPTPLYANQPRYFPYFVPAVAPGQHVGLFSDQGGVLAIGSVAEGAGSWVVAPNTGALPGANASVVLQIQQRLKIGWKVASGIRADAAQEVARVNPALFAIGTDPITTGTYPAVAGTSVGNAGLGLVHRIPFAEDGTVDTISVYAGGAGGGVVFLARRAPDGTTSVTAEASVTFAAGVNTFTGLGFKAKRGDFYGVYSSGTLGLSETAGPGLYYFTGQPSGVGASLGLGYLPRQPQISAVLTPALLAESERAMAAEEALRNGGGSGSSGVTRRAYEPLGVAIVTGTITGAGNDGQSNAQDYGALSDPPITTTQPYSNVMLSGSSLVPLVSPDHEKSQVTSANYASLELARRYSIAPASAPWAAFNVGVGGASIDPAVSNNIYNSDGVFQNAYQSWQADNGYRFLIINWVQGETDIGSGMSQATYKTLMMGAMNNRQTGVRGITGHGAANLIYVMMQPSANLLAAGASAGPVLAQLELAQTSPQYVMTRCPMYRFPARSDDHIHLTNVMTKLKGAYHGIANADVRAGRKPQWMNPRAATYATINGVTVVTVYYDVPVAPMFFDPDELGTTTDQGFAVTANGTRATLTSVAVQNGTELVLTCSALLSGTIKARGGLDYLGSNRGIIDGASTTLRDSAPETIIISGQTYQMYSCSPHFELTAVGSSV